MKEKRLDFELLRIFAIFGVVFNHTELRGFELYMLPECSGVNYTASLLLGILCKIAVPLFFLVSGGLLLDREEPIRTLLKKRVLRVAAALGIFSVALYLFHVAWGYVPSPGAWDFLKGLWKGNLCAPYWYLYTYLGLLLLLPLLRPMVRNMPDWAFVYLTALHLILHGVLEPIGIITGWGSVTSDLLLPLAEPSLFYFLMGYYLACRFPWEKLTGKRLAMLWGGALISVAGIYLLADFRFRWYHNGIEYLKCLLAPMVFAVYATAYRLCRRHPLGLRERRGV